MPFVDLGQVHLHYLDEGDGAPLVLLHSLGGSSVMWAEIIPMLGQRFRVIAPDLRGHGRSTQGIAAEIGPCADDIVCLLNHLGISRSAFIGISMGGQIAMKIATRGDCRVLAMVLANTSAGAAVRDSSRLDEVRTRIDHAGWPHFAREYVASRLAPMTSGPQVEEYVRSVIGATPKVFVQTMASILEQDLRPFLSKVDCPTLVLTGDSDISTPLAAAEELRAAIPKAKLVVLSRAGHFSVLDQPEEFAARSVSFLARHEDGAW
jgi:3-oxoadipate enol-lactonase